MKTGIQKLVSGIHNFKLNMELNPVTISGRGHVFTGIKSKCGNFYFLKITIVMFNINKILKPRYLLVLLVLGGGALLTMLQATSNECFSTAERRSH